MGGRQWLLGDAYALTRKRVLSTLRYVVWASRAGDVIQNQLAGSYSFKI